MAQAICCTVQSVSACCPQAASRPLRQRRASIHKVDFRFFMVFSFDIIRMRIRIKYARPRFFPRLLNSIPQKSPPYNHKEESPSEDFQTGILCFITSDPKGRK